MRGQTSQALTIPQQQGFMMCHFPGFSFTQSPNQGVWRGELQPQEGGTVYRVRLIYCLRDRPRVHVIAPTLVSGAPHLYPGGELCLYYPSDGTWHSQRPLATTIVPMTAEWLLFYEWWLESGTWWGPEAPHTPQAVENHLHRLTNGSGYWKQKPKLRHIPPSARRAKKE